MKQHLLVAEFLATPWALQRERLTAFAGVMGRWASGTPAAMEHDEPGERISAFDARRMQAQARAGSGSGIA